MHATGMAEDEAAIASWEKLDVDTRRAVTWAARRLVAYPDPDIAAIAAAYGRAELRRQSRRRYRTPTAPVLLLTAITIGAAVWLPWFTSQSLAVYRLFIVGLVALLAAACALLVISIVRFNRRRRIKLLTMMEAVNRAATAPPPLVSTPKPGEDRPSALGHTVFYDKRKLIAATVRWLALPAIAAAVTALVAVSLHSSNAAISVLLGQLLVLLGLITALLVARTVMLVLALHRWVLRRHPMLEMDSSGINIASIDVSVTWDQLVEVHIYPYGAPDRRSDVPHVLALVTQEPVASLASLKGRRRRQGIRALQVYGTPLAFSDRWLDHTAEEVAEIIERHFAVPISRF